MVCAYSVHHKRCNELRALAQWTPSINKPRTYSRACLYIGSYSCVYKCRSIATITLHIRHVSPPIVSCPQWVRVQ